MEQLDRALVVRVPRSSHRERERSQWQDGCIAAIDVEEQPSDGTIDRESIGDGEASDSSSVVHDAHLPRVRMLTSGTRGPAFGRLKEPDEIDGHEEREDDGMRARHLPEVVYALPRHVHLPQHRTLHFRQPPSVVLGHLLIRLQYWGAS